jgi:hypothetical protein
MLAKARFHHKSSRNLLDQAEAGVENRFALIDAYAAESIYGLMINRQCVRPRD